LLADLQKERGFPHPSRKKKLLKFKRESTCSEPPIDAVAKVVPKRAGMKLVYLLGIYLRGFGPACKNFGGGLI
jgi:hypothetical protein